MKYTGAIPGWLTEGLIKEEEVEKTEGVTERMGLWQKAEVDGKAVLVRTAKKQTSIPIRRAQGDTDIWDIRPPIWEGASEREEEPPEEAVPDEYLDLFERRWAEVWNLYSFVPGVQDIESYTEGDVQEAWGQGIESDQLYGWIVSRFIEPVLSEGAEGPVEELEEPVAVSDWGIGV